MPAARLPRVVNVEIFGIQRVRRQILRGEAVAVNPKPALELVADDMLRVLGVTFTSQGRRYGGGWKHLDPAWIRRKAAHGEDPRILIATGALMRAMSVRGSAHQILHVTRNKIILDTDLPYAEAQDRVRPYVRFYPPDRLRWSKIVTKYIVDAMRGV